MKLFLAYKKQSSWQFSSIFFSILLIFIFYAVPVFFSSAQSEQDIRNKINQKDADIEKLEAEIKTYQGQLNTLGQQKSSLSGAIKELDLTKKKLQTDIALTEKKIDKTNLTIESLSSDIGTKEEVIANHKKSIALELQKTDEIERTGIVETVLSENDFTVIWNDIDNMITVREKIVEDIAQLRQVKEELEGTREVSIRAKAELTALKSKLSDQQKIVIQNTSEKNKLLQQTKNNEANYQKLLQEKIAKRDAFEKELRDFEAQLQFILDPSKLPGKSVLSWPLSNIFVTSPYGPRGSGFHRGVDFRASVGTSVMSMADGVVKGVGDTDAC